MAIRATTLAVPVADFAASLLARQEVAPRAQVIAQQAAELLPGTGVVVYLVENQEEPAWTAKATAGEVTVAEVMEFREGTLGEVAESKSAETFDGAKLQREDYAQLDVRRTGVALAYVPLLAEETLIGAIELISHEQPFSKAALEALAEIAELASPAIAAALNSESERNASLYSISRVTQMYDLEKVFNSTLEMDELLEIIAKKFHEVMNVQAINLWMVNGDAVELISQAGADPTVQIGKLEPPGEGIAGDRVRGQQLWQQEPGIQDLSRRKVLIYEHLDHHSHIRRVPPRFIRRGRHGGR